MILWNLQVFNPSKYVYEPSLSNDWSWYPNWELSQSL
jgi:hypothetical protein